MTLGSNLEARRVAMIFGDPLADPPNFVTFTPDQARDLARQMLLEADKAEGLVSAKSSLVTHTLSCVSKPRSH